MPPGNPAGYLQNDALQRVLAQAMGRNEVPPEVRAQQMAQMQDEQYRRNAPWLRTYTEQSGPTSMLSDKGLKFTPVDHSAAINANAQEKASFARMGETGVRSADSQDSTLAALLGVGAHGDQNAIERERLAQEVIESGKDRAHDLQIAGINATPDPSVAPPIDFSDRDRVATQIALQDADSPGFWRGIGRIGRAVPRLFPGGETYTGSKADEKINDVIRAPVVQNILSKADAASPTALAELLRGVNAISNSDPAFLKQLSIRGEQGDPAANALLEALERAKRIGAAASAAQLSPASR